MNDRHGDWWFSLLRRLGHFSLAPSYIWKLHQEENFAVYHFPLSLPFAKIKFIHWLIYSIYRQKEKITSAHKQRLQISGV